MKKLNVGSLPVSNGLHRRLDNGDITTRATAERRNPERSGGPRSDVAADPNSPE